MDPQFWRNRPVLVTGHSGFKGSWLAVWLSHLGARVSGISLEPPSTPSLFALARVDQVADSTLSDVRNLDAFDSVCRKCNPEIIFHLAAQSLVRESYRDPVTTFSTNVLGTVNCLEAARRSESVRAVVVVTTDKCYRNRGEGKPFRENDELGGTDPYAASKAGAELVTDAYRVSFFTAGPRKLLVASVRAGNVIGGGDWAVDRLVPDAMRAFAAGKPLGLRNPSSTRPWQHVLDPLHGYLTLGERLLRGEQGAARAWNLGPDAADIRTVRWVADELVARWGNGAQWQITGGEGEPKEAEVLALDSTLARRDLRWAPRLPLPSALDWTVEWYKCHQRGENLQSATLSQIARFMALHPAASRST